MSSPLQPSSFRLWLRLYAHALLLESRIFPNLELCDGSPDYAPYGLADIWKGNYRGEPVCIKVIRTRDSVRLMEIRRVSVYFIHQSRTKRAPYQTLRREINGRKPGSHPNVLPIMQVSETLVPFCIMSPWMPDGNIIQFTQMNPGGDRLLLVRAHQLEEESADYPDK